jgi:hypothetical protein
LTLSLFRKVVLEFRHRQQMNLNKGGDEFVCCDLLLVAVMPEGLFPHAPPHAGFFPGFRRAT